VSKSFSWPAFEKIPLIGIMRNIPIDKTALLASHFLQSGLTTLEVTMNSAGAQEIITQLSVEFGESLNIGAGTVLTLADLEKALSAGATFIVTPILNDEVIKSCVAAGIPVFPGAFTPTEIYKAWAMGASMVKVFPATKLGPDYIKEVLAPLNSIKLVPTGGITINNFLDFLKAGATGLGMGSQLFNTEMIKNNRWDELDNLFSEFVAKYKAVYNRQVSS
jgi:2-dehydro-3-deoxyphosphogluconate aldolase/(4S)-4-hydroxy-2-oxoglutarate aldolase